MAVTESIITEKFGYNKNQLRRKRSQNWEYGVQYWVEGGGTTVYSVKEILRWQKESARAAASVESIGDKTARATSARWKNPTRPAGSRKLLE